MFRAGNRLCGLSKQVTGKAIQKHILIDNFKHVCKVTLNNPKALNSLSLEMIR